MDESEIEMHVLTSSRDLDDYDVLALHTISAAVPYRTTESYRKLIWAAMVTYMWGNKSVDYVLRRYDYLWQRFKHHSVERSPKILALRSMVEKIDQLSARLEALKIGDSIGPICAKAALCRLEASFKAAYGLIRKNYIFETDAVVRLILEQLAWAYSAFSVTDESVFALQPNKCISRLKAVFPNAGVLYGELSEWAHIDPDITRNYVHFHQEGTPVVRRSAGDSLASGLRLVRLAAVYCAVVQEMFAPLDGHVYSSLSRDLDDLYRSYNQTPVEGRDGSREHEV